MDYVRGMFLYADPAKDGETRLEPAMQHFDLQGHRSVNTELWLSIRVHFNSASVG